MKSEHELIEMLHTHQVIQKHIPDENGKIIIHTIADILGIRENDVNYNIETIEQIKDKIRKGK